MSTTNKISRSILGKRKFDSAFGNNCFDDERYGNHIDENFFEKGGLGHGVFLETSLKNGPELNKQIQEIDLRLINYTKTQ